MSKHRRKERVLVWEDTHIPEHDPRAVACALAIVKDFQPDELIVIGDFLNCGAFSRHPKGSLAEAKQHSFKQTELLPGLMLLEELAEHAGRIVYIEGNHEGWVTRYCANNDKVSIHDLISPQVVFSEHFEKQRYPFTWIPYYPEGAGLDTGYHIITPELRDSSALLATHGWSAAKHATANHRVVAGHYSVVHGHSHRAQFDAGKDPITGMEYESWSFGCLCSLKPSYVPGAKPVDWVHGIGQVFIGKHSWDIRRVSIKNGQAIADGGKEYVAKKAWVAA